MTSCPPGTSPYSNSVIAKQANNYSGDPGNNMTAGTNFDTSVEVVGTCSDDVATTALSQTGLNGSYTLVSNGEANGRLYSHGGGRWQRDDGVARLDGNGLDDGGLVRNFAADFARRGLS